MKLHLVVKLHQPLSNDSAVPNWLDFITDKSVIRETVTPDVDRVLRDARPAGLDHEGVSAGGMRPGAPTIFARDWIALPGDLPAGLRPAR